VCDARRRATPATRPGGRVRHAESIEWQVEEIPVQPANPTNFYTEVHKALTTDAPFPVTLEEARAVVEITERARQGTGY